MKKLINKHKNVLYKVGTQGMAKLSLAVIRSLFAKANGPFNLFKFEQGYRKSSAPRARKSSFFGVFESAIQCVASSTSRARALSLQCTEIAFDRNVHPTPRAQTLSGLYGQFIDAKQHASGLTPRARMSSLMRVVVRQLGRRISSTSRARALSLFGVLLVGFMIPVAIYTNQAHAATSDELNFQGRLLTNTGGLVPDGTYNMEFNLYYVSSGGSTLWTEDRLNTNTQGVTIRNGYFSVYLGSLDAFPGTIDWSQDLYLGMTVRGTGSCAWGACTPTDSEMTPRFKLTSVPYAFRAANVASSDVDSADSDDVSITTGDTTTSGTSGDIIIDTGAGVTANGGISLGATNASTLTIGNGSATTTFQGSVTFTGTGAALTVNNNTVLGSDGTDTLTVNAAATFNGNLTVSAGDLFTNAGATLFTAITIPNDVDGGVLGGTAGATVDIATTLNVNQTTTSQTFTLASPTTTTSGRIVYINNVGSASFTLEGNPIAAGESASYIWNGTSWVQTISFTSTGVDTIGALDGGTPSANGAFISGTTIYLQSASVTQPGLVNTSAQTFAGVKTFNDGAVIAAGGTLRVIGDTTLNRPAGAEGELYFDTDTNNLLQYNGTKWQAFRGEYTIVAANDSTQAEKDAADYVADGTADQTEINNALTAAAGGKVLLLAGTYTINGSISIPDNTTLEGQGMNTVITIPNALNVAFSAVVNTNTVNGTGIAIRNLKLDGNRSNQSGFGYGMAGIALNNMGSGTTIAGSTIENVTSINWYINGSGTGCEIGAGICLLSSDNNSIVNTTTAGSVSGTGIYLSGSNNNTMTANTLVGFSTGINLDTSNYNTISGSTLIDNGVTLTSSVNNTIASNTIEATGSVGISLNTNSNENTITGNTVKNAFNYGIHINSGSSTNVISGNNVINSGQYGISFFSSSNSNQVIGNTIKDSNGVNQNNGIYTNSSDYNAFAGNTISDNSCNTTCYAINIGFGSDKTYLEGNRYWDTDADAGDDATINDAGTNTIYVNQQTNTVTSEAYDVTDFTFRGSANSTTAFEVQNAAGTNILNVDTTNGELEVTGNIIATGNLQIDGNTTLGNAAGDTLTVTGSSITFANGFTSCTAINTNGSGVLGCDTNTYLTAATISLQGAYNGGNTITTTDNRNIVFSLADTTTDSDFIVDLLGTGNTFEVQDSGTTVLSVVDGGGVTLQNSSDSANAFRVLSSAGGTYAGAKVLGVDTTNFAVDLAATRYQTITNATCAVNCTITQSNVDQNAAIIVEATVGSLEINLPDPTDTTAGRLVYITAANGSEDFTLIANGGGTNNEIAMRQNTTATMIWNGSDWTAAGASSSTTLQAAYDNTLTSAGGAEIVLNNTATSNGLTVRNNSTTPIIGSIFEAQTSVGSNLFSVNNNAVEYATNGGAESAFSSDWSNTPGGGTVTRYTTQGNYIATGVGSVEVVTTGSASAGQGAENTLSSALTPNLQYSVSFAVRGTSSFNTLDVYYSPDGTTTGEVACVTGETVTQGKWTRIICTFDAPASGITATNSIFIRQSDSNTNAYTYYVENLSVTVKADVNHAADGDVDSAGNFSTNWTATGSATASYETTTIYNTSASARTITTAAIGDGIRNNLSITPSPSTQYLVTFYAQSSNTFDDIRVRYSRDGGTSFVSCTDYNTQSVSTTSWTRITCLFTTDGTTATNPDLIIDQPTATARTFYIDAMEVTLNENTASNVQIGGGNLGGPTTLFTLDRSAGAPVGANNDAYLGSMYYDTVTGRIQCYEAGGWGTCGAPPDNIVNLNPEYAGSVLNGSGIGTMQADVCANESGVLQVNSTLCGTGEARSFYTWTSPQSTQQTYSIYVTYQLPSTFDGFASDDTVTLTGRVSNTTNAAVTYEMFRSENGAITQCGSGETNVATTANTWQTVGINGNEATGCGFTSSSANAFVIFKINLKANSNADAYVSTLSFTTTGR